MMMIIAATFVVIVFIIVFSTMISNDNIDKKKVIMKDFGYYLQNEFIMASKAKQGYKRSFILPYSVEGVKYNVYINDTLLVIDYFDNFFTLRIPQTNGQPKIGNNIIIHNEDTICLNC